MSVSPLKKTLILVGTILIAFLLVLLFWLNRGDWVYPTQPNASQTLDVMLASDSTVGQTFVARQSGLQGVGVKIQQSDTLRGKEIFLSVYDAPDKNAKLLRRVSATVGDITGTGYLYFKFQPLSNSRHQYYYFTLQTNDDVQIRLYADALSRYMDGSAYENGEPFDAQLAFHLNYNRRMMAVDFFRRMVAGIPAALATGVMLFLPGSTLLVWLRPRMTLDVIEWSAIAVGVSLAVIPVLLTYLRYLPLALNSDIVWAIYGVTAVFLVLGARRFLRVKQLNISSDVRRNVPAYLAFAVIFILSLTVRLQVVSGIEIPLWADSYHHTVITQLIVDNGKLVSNWQPYAPLTSLNYHYGFHTMTAVFHWLTGLSVPKSVIFFGQVLNGLAVLMAYLLGRRFGENVWVGVFAALITGLLSKYPMFYVNWGRYTQLAGQILLPVLMVLTWELLRKNIRSLWLIGLNVLLIAALFFTHYRVILFYPAFVVPILLIRWYQARWDRSTIIEDVIRLFVVFAATSLLIAPRVIELMNSRLWIVSEASAKAGMANEYTRQVHNAMGNLFDVLSPLVVVMGWVGFGLGCWGRKRGIFSMGMWWLMLLLVTNPQWLHLPGAGQITNFAIFIGAYIIFSVLSGFAFSVIINTMIQKKAFVGWVTLFFILVLVVVGGESQLRIIEPSNKLVTSADLRAMEWIKTNTSEDAKFLVNSQLAYGGSIIIGTDAGWWIPYLTLRKNTVPPMEYGNESTLEPTYYQDLYEIFYALIDTNVEASELSRRMTDRNIQYIYIGQQRGSVGQENDFLLVSEKFISSKDFSLVYTQDGVRVFKVAATTGAEYLSRQ